MLTVPVRNHTVTELESLTVIWAIKKLREYVVGSHFEIIPDHDALRWHKISRIRPVV